MLSGESLPFIRDYISAINEGIKQEHPEKALSRIQRCWLSFVLLGLLVTNSLCWQRFERFGLGEFNVRQMSWMFRYSKIFWDFLLTASIQHVLTTYNIRSGILVIDDSDKPRSKSTTDLAYVHKIKDKKTGGYFNGQNIVFLVLVSDALTIPVGFDFYQPDPKKSAWQKEENRLKAKGVEKKHRPAKPEPDENYPNKVKIGLNLLSQFKKNFPDIRIRAVNADEYYCTEFFMEEAAHLTNQNQVVSQIKKTQLIQVNNQMATVENFFKNYQSKELEIILRGQNKKATYRSIRCKVKSHQKKYFVIALKYENETEYRYLIGRDMTWREEDIIQAYAYRWLVEVFIQDWKSYEGWNQLAKQTGEKGADRGLTLSLLCDHALLLHNEQLISFENKQPALTVGSLREKVMMESLMLFIQEIIESDDPKATFEAYADKISELFALRRSIKHIRDGHIDSLKQSIFYEENERENKI